MSEVSGTVRVAIDVGGTFTDVVKLTPDDGMLRFEKVPTTPSEPTSGVLAAFERADIDYGSTATFNHGTTLGLNSLLTRTGAKVAVIATAGFRDVYLLGRTDRKVMYDIAYHKPEPLLQRSDTFEVTERMLFDGSVKTPLDTGEATELAKKIADGGYQAVAIAFLHSYANPSHELEMREILHAYAPEVEITCSHELAREYREYERTSTAVLDAYIKPIIHTYLQSLEKELDKRGFRGEFLMSRSGGGAMTAKAAREQPVNLILSGPAGGVIGAAAFSRLAGYPNLITIDMGGTSLDASLVLNHEPLVYQGSEFEGLPLTITSLNIQTIGAGGGSLAWLDAAGALQVGPQSAGADPGPASYGKGGTQPTFTDAALEIGYLGTDTPLGGRLVLDKQKAEAALGPVAEKLGLAVNDVARGIVQISTTKILGAVRAITIELGLDPKDFALLAFGGGGGLVAVDVARELGIPAVIIPPGQGAFSAMGMLMADVQHDYARTLVRPLDGIDTARVEAEFQAMEAEAKIALVDEGFPVERQLLHRSVDVRYQGQEHSVSVVCPPLIGTGFEELVRDEFEELHKRQYGHIMSDPIELTTLRLSAIGAIEKPNLPEIPKRTVGDSAPIPRERLVYRGDGTYEKYALYSREELLSGDVLRGPLVCTEHTATTVLHDGDTLTVGPYGEMVIALGSHKDGE